MTRRRRVAVFCGSATGNDPRIADVAAALAQGMARRGLDLIYGGAAVGLMGRLADAALSAGSEVVGILPQALMEREIGHQGLTRLEVVDSMHGRKARMANLADAFIALPGGFGTLDELCEIITWRQLGIHSKPIGLLDPTGFFTGLLQQVQDGVRLGFIRASHAEALVVAAEPEPLLDALAAQWEEQVPKRSRSEPTGAPTP